MHMQKQNYAVAALDMDGTLLNSAHVISDYTGSIIRRAAGQGRMIALATGRCLAELWKPLERLEGVRYLICENGACVYDILSRNFIRNISFDPETAVKIIETAVEYDLMLQIFSDHRSYIRFEMGQSMEPYHLQKYYPIFEEGSLFWPDLLDRISPRSAHIEKINLYFAHDRDRRQFAERMQGSGVVMAESIGLSLELSPRGVSKAEGLKALCVHLGVPVAESMAVGDGGNDLEILRAAGLAVAMGNAIDEVKRLAGAITEDCDHDGAAKAIQRYMLGENV